MHQLIVFLSSTVDDLHGVRDEIAAALTGFGIKVWHSESHDFPVKAGLTSHEACLEAARHADIVVTLIAMRYGGEVSGASGKSITWCELEAATAASVYPIVLIREDMNDIAARIAPRRKQLVKKFSTLTEPQIDEKLKKDFPDVKPYVQNLPAQQRFIDAVRKGRTDNWAHMKWTGTTGDAVSYIMSKVASLLVSLLTATEESTASNDAMRRLLDWFFILRDEIAAGRRTPSEAVDRILDLAEEFRKQLFGFREADLFNFMLYRREGDVLKPEARKTHEAIAVQNRTWAVGEGHAGKAILETGPIVTPYLPETPMWKSDPAHDAADRANYASAVSVPLKSADGKTDRLFIVTSSRRDHFKTKKQPAALTCITVGRILGVLSKETN
jgi:hypothetical protein